MRKATCVTAGAGASPEVSAHFLEASQKCTKNSPPADNDLQWVGQRSCYTNSATCYEPVTERILEAGAATLKGVVKYSSMSAWGGN